MTYTYIHTHTHIYIYIGVCMSLFINLKKKVIYNGCKTFGAQRIVHSILKQSVQKQDLMSVLDAFRSKPVCNISGRVCLSKARVACCMMRAHDNKQSQADFKQVLPQQPTGNSCQFCYKVCRSVKGLRSHMRMHGVNVNAKDSSFVCLIYVAGCFQEIEMSIFCK